MSDWPPVVIAVAAAVVNVCVTFGIDPLAWLEGSPEEIPCERDLGVVGITIIRRESARDGISEASGRGVVVQESDGAAYRDTHHSTRTSGSHDGAGASVEASSGGAAL